jgi:quercetin dioxygenase-like cupin family protein
MIRTGQTIENPVTGEVLIFRQTSRDTAGAYVLVETILRPGATVAAAHVHPYQSESFQVLEGRVGMKVGRRKVELGAGEGITVLPGTGHRFWNAGDGEARFTCEVRPASAFEQLIETMFGLATDGKTSKRGMPSPLRLAVIARHHFGDVRLPWIPDALQRAALAVGAPIGKAFGYGERYEAAGELESAVA